MYVLRFSTGSIAAEQKILLCCFEAILLCQGNGMSNMLHISCVSVCTAFFCHMLCQHGAATLAKWWADAAQCTKPSDTGSATDLNSADTSTTNDTWAQNAMVSGEEALMVDMSLLHALLVIQNILGVHLQQPQLPLLLMQARPDGKMPFELLPMKVQAHSRSTLQVWLGSTQGWSLPVSFDQSLPQVSIQRSCCFFCC